MSRRLIRTRRHVFREGNHPRIGSNTSGDTKNKAWLYYSDPNSTDWGAYNGVFLTTLPSNSEYFLGLHPCSDNNVISSLGGTSFSATIDIPAAQTYRNDNTFDKQVFPMVAWYGGTWTSDPYTPFNLDFHSLAAIVRLQFLNTTGAASAIRSITVTSPDKQLCGLFTVNNYNTNDPYLSSLESAKKTVTIDCGESGVAFANNQLLTFYLVLPAYTGRDNTTRYSNLSVTVTNTSSQSCSSTISFVNTRRNGITYMQALDINSWTSGSPSPTISGNGTADRPFKIYDVEDLKYLRDCYNSTARTINGQPITADTYIKLMRSDIVLTNSNWMAGIRNFVGHFLTMNQQSHPGITNTCQNVPLFESIDADGEVVGLTVKSSGSNSMTNTTGVSPFCTQNDGRIIDCVITNKPGSSDYTISIFSPFAGICVTNNGTIQGCRCEARVQVQSNKNFAGICLHNNGTIVGCHATDMTLRDFSAKGAGICFENTASGVVKDCYFASNIMNSNADWGGIVYDNSGTVKHCYMSATGQIYTSKSVGGVVRNNIGSSSLVDYCWVAGPPAGQDGGRHRRQPRQRRSEKLLQQQLRHDHRHLRQQRLRRSRGLRQRRPGQQQLRQRDHHHTPQRQRRHRRPGRCRHRRLLQLLLQLRGRQRLLRHHDSGHLHPVLPRRRLPGQHHPRQQQSGIQLRHPHQQPQRQPLPLVGPAVVHLGPRALPLFGIASPRGRPEQDTYSNSNDNSPVRISYGTVAINGT